MSERGFTLLEVLAAAAILAISYTALLSIHLESARAEGRSLHRIDAALLADEKLAELEERLKPGEVIDRAPAEGEEGDYGYSMKIANLADCGVRTDWTKSQIPPAQSTVLGSPAVREDMVCLQVIVSWQDGEDVKQIQRMTFAYDRQNTLNRRQQFSQQAQGQAGQNPAGPGGGAQPTPGGLPNLGLPGLPTP